MQVFIIDNHATPACPVLAPGQDKPAGTEGGKHHEEG